MAGLPLAIGAWPILPQSCDNPSTGDVKTITLGTPP
jgi:hypothetical protein